MTHCFLISDILDFCYDAPDSPIQEELARSMLIDPVLLDTVRYIMSLKLQFSNRAAVETHLEQNKQKALASTIQNIQRAKMSLG